MTRWLGVALLPSAGDMRSAIRLQKDVGDGHALRPLLSSEGNLPHLTVFQGPFARTLAPEGALEEIRESVNLPEEVRLAAAGVVHQPTGWVFLSLERPPLLESLQEAALAVLAPHLDRAAFDTSKDTSHFSENERAGFARYGYRYTGDAYAPHITLGRTDERVARELVRSVPGRVSVPQEWTFDRLSVYVMGEHGAHSETLVECTLHLS